MPQAIPYIMMAATAVSAVGQIQQGQANKASAQASAAASEYNAKVNEQNAIAAENKAKYDEQMHREQVRALLSKQRAIIGKSGVTMEGSPLLATLDTVEKGELDALAIRYGGKVQSQQYRSGADISRMESSAYLAKGKSAMTGALFGAGTTLLSGGASAYKTYKGF